MGYRVALAALDETARRGMDPTTLVATTGNDTCAVDGIQSVTGCTFGKRNLIPALTGKPAYLWQDARSGEGVRIYVHYWEQFDREETFRSRMSEWKLGCLPTPEAKAFEAEHERMIADILEAPAETLFRVTPYSGPPPARSGGFAASPCAKCGEHAKQSLLTDGICRECRSRE